MSTNKIPEIRFNGFVEEWENRKLEDICEHLEYGLNASATNYDGINKYLRITDIDEKSRKFILDGVTSPNYYLEDSDNFLLKNGDVLFARTGASVGKTYVYRPKDGIVYFAGFLIRGRVKKEFSSELVFQYTLTDNYKKYIQITSQRSGQPGVNAQEYGAFPINLPPSKTEQTKIGSFFENIDQLVNQHQTQHKKLTALKKAMLSKLFPKQGKKIPEIRFKGFSEEWEVKKLGEVLSFKNGQGHEQIISESGKIIVINSKYISSNGNTAKYCENIIVPLKNKDIVMVMSDIPNGKALAKCMLITNEKNYSLNQRICALSEQNDDNIFLFYQINRNNYFLSFDNGVSQTNLKLQEILDCPLFCPDKKEQEKIGNYFQNLDNLIANHSQQLEKLEVLKKACLAKMFV
ncbi:restriction endonuclease subunit S [Tenacibaculum finnmarkense]|uniref:restriction endonuclease subunit S n=1 Tax=Tenacibaculum finnmarkense TaxID=2781243 RepID=UPI000C566116|nr:restriction endonuclease subunit S [Tenacibaculum finnmarkense]MCD8439296.1 restriction endonuclease subunit S [Tenacibaculum finnmarkense genomovar ulcerans]MCG8720144.1 restriction endonuclease subunit S [Tenacibaculum finnmarkense]SOS55653.1 Restriction modification system DNA specificity domain [Tenacibaculum finnmarkense]